jgi:hypothetical protein
MQARGNDPWLVDDCEAIAAMLAITLAVLL